VCKKSEICLAHKFKKVLSSISKFFSFSGTSTLIWYKFQSIFQGSSSKIKSCGKTLSCLIKFKIAVFFHIFAGQVKRKNQDCNCLDLIFSVIFVKISYAVEFQ